MAYNDFSMAQHVVTLARKGYLTGVAAGVAFRLQGVTKAKDARALVDKAAGAVDEVTAKAIKSFVTNMSNQWNFNGEVLAKLSTDDRKAIKACGPAGAIERIADAMTAHMALLRFALKPSLWRKCATSMP